MSMDLSALSNSAFSSDNSASATKANELKSKLNNIEGATDEELMNVCKEFETYMIEQVVKSMQSTINKDDEESSTSYMSMFGDKLTTEYAKSISDQGNIGLAQMLYDSMKR